MDNSSVLLFDIVILALLLLNTLACDTPANDTVSKAAPYATSQPLERPKLFGRGIISTALPEFATSFSPHGETIYFNIADKNRSQLKIVQSTFADGGWSEPVHLAFSDGTYRDVDPFVTQDGSRLYFSSNRPVMEGESKDDFDTWYVDWLEEGWSEPVNPGSPLNQKRSEIFVSITNSGALYFGAFDEGVGHIYRALENDGKYHAPERVTLGLADSVAVGNPMIAPDESFLIFSADMLAGEGGSDLYVSMQTKEGTWGEIKNLGNIVNSPYAEFAPALSPDGQYLFFTSERPGMVGVIHNGRPPGDLYQVSLSVVIP